jgi:hypothetical protein
VAQGRRSAIQIPWPTGAVLQQAAAGAIEDGELLQDDGELAAGRARSGAVRRGQTAAGRR